MSSEENSMKNSNALSLADYYDIGVRILLPALVDAALYSVHNIILLRFFRTTQIPGYSSRFITLCVLFYVLYLLFPKQKYLGK